MDSALLLSKAALNIFNHHRIWNSWTSQAIRLYDGVPAAHILFSFDGRSQVLSVADLDLESGSAIGITVNMDPRSTHNPFKTSSREPRISSRRRQAVAHHQGHQGYPAGAAYDVSVDALPSREQCVSPTGLDDTAYYTSGRVQQWAADNETGLLAVPKQNSTRNTNTSLDVTNTQAMLRVGESVPGAFPVSQFDTSHVSLPASNGAYQSVDYSTTFSGAGPYSAASGHNVPEIATPYVFHGTSTSGYDELTQSIWPADEMQTQPVAVSLDGLYTNSADLPYSLSHQGVNYDYLGNWPYGPLTGASNVPSMHAMTMSPLSSATADHSMSSSYSPASLLAPPSGSPISSNIQGDESCLETNIFPDEVCGPGPRFTIGESMLATVAPDYSHEQDILSRSVSTAVSPSDSGTVTEGFCRTVRPSGSLQRPIVPSTASLAPTQQFEELCIIPPVGDDLRRRSSVEADVAPAREHELYHAVPREDGLYHCPFEGQANCAHKPTKLKCNYDKNVDSHLKPYRCKISACGDTRFSSTACLLRHEREAHGMHGHGAKPHLCTYEDCERSMPGNGFPRRWNLYDHMRRVHDYTGPPSSNGSASPALSSSSSQYQTTSGQAFRKRKSSAASDTQPPRKHKAVSMTRSRSDMRRLPTSSATQDRQLHNMETEWKEHQARLRLRMDCLRDPDDSLSLEQITADMAVLRTIAMNIRRLKAGQLANEDTQYGPG